MENLTYRPLTEADKREICDWKYEGDYALYNLPSYEEMQEQQMGLQILIIQQSQDYQLQKVWQ